MIKFFKEYFFITIGFILIAVSAEYFFLPQGMATGGVTGISLIISYYVPILTTGMNMVWLNILLFILGFAVLGKAFGAKTIYASLGLSFTMWFMEQHLAPHAVTNDLMLTVIFGSLLLGTGLATIFGQNASSGGTDIIAKVLNKFFHINIGTCMQIVDLFVVIGGAVAFGLDKGLYSMVVVLLTGMVINKVISGFNSCKEIMIMSSKLIEIKQFITSDLDRGCTMLEGQGGYTGARAQVIYCVLSTRELIRLKSYIKAVDPRAFVTVKEAHEVMGEGFNNLG